MGGGRYERVRRDRVRERGESCGADTLGGIGSKICRLGTLGLFDTHPWLPRFGPTPCLAAGPPSAPPPRRSLSREGEGGEEGGKCHPAGVPAALTCGRDDAATIVVAAIARPLLPANAAIASTADVLGRQYSPLLAVAPLLLRQLLLLLQLPWGIGVCISIHRHCHRHCQGGNLAVIVATSAAIAAAVGGGRTRMIAS
jgi:hypothetical protein